jgi:2-(1,2-epoxy-1,2-dihydrophenyl)acetyl-CoA isomerase
LAKAGLGAHLAFASDLIIASADARFILVFVRRGVAVDAGGAFLLPPLSVPGAPLLARSSH